MRVTNSVTRPATLIRQRRMVSNWVSRQNDVRGARPRKVSISQYAAVWISSQQGPVADHLGEAVPHLFRRSWVLDAIRQALGDPEPLLDRRQQQYPGVRGQPATVESDMHRLARNRW